MGDFHMCHSGDGAPPKKFYSGQRKKPLWFRPGNALWSNRVHLYDIETVIHLVAVVICFHLHWRRIDLPLCCSLLTNVQREETASVARTALTAFVCLADRGAAIELLTTHCVFSLP